jgi:hypothetical protein
MYELKNFGKVFTRKFVGTGPALVLWKKNLPGGPRSHKGWETLLYTTQSLDIIFAVALCSPYITLTSSFWTAESPGTNTCVLSACSDVRPAMCLRSACLLHQNTRCLCKPVYCCDNGEMYLLSGWNLIGKCYLQAYGFQSSEIYILDL